MADSERNEQNVIAFYDLSFNQFRRARPSSDTRERNTYSTTPALPMAGKPSLTGRPSLLPWIICVMAICLQGHVFDARYLTARRRRTTSRMHEHSRHSVVDSFECPRLEWLSLSDDPEDLEQGPSRYRYLPRSMPAAG
jgi:hypothetical protein